MMVPGAILIAFGAGCFTAAAWILAHEPTDLHARIAIMLGLAVWFALLALRVE